MSSRSDAAADPEAPWPPAPPARTCRPLPWALGAGVLLLAATCAACVARTWMVPAARASAGPSPGSATSGARSEDPELSPNAPANLRQGQAKFAKLLAENVVLTNETLSWYSQPGLKGVHLSPGLRYDEDLRELVVAEKGLYYVFLQLELRRRANLPAWGRVSLHLHLQGLAGAPLALAVDLPCASERRNSAGGFRGGLLHLAAGQRLSVRMHAEAHARDAWQLAQGATALGLFLVTTEVPNGLF